VKIFLLHLGCNIDRWDVINVEKLKIGILGTAKIAPIALIGPAESVPTVQVAAIASRDEDRARKFAEIWDIPTAYGSYEELLENPVIEVIYNPLPNSMHAEWSIRALWAGKHVLCEKPLASNAIEAQEMCDVAEETGLNLTEAFHYRYHPLAVQLKDIATGGDIGVVEHVNTTWLVPLPKTDIRFDYALAGGSMMDLGCYGVNFLRYVAGEEPEVTNAQAECVADQIDGRMEADLAFPGGLSGHVESAMSDAKYKEEIRMVGTEGECYCQHSFFPQGGALLRVIKGSAKTHVKVDPKETYVYQLEIFARAIAEGTPTLTPATDAVKNMRVIDAIYEKAGLKIRGLKDES